MAAAVVVPEVAQFQVHNPSEKTSESFRQYEGSTLSDRNRAVYTEMHTKQCLQFVKDKHRQFGGFNHASMTIMEAAEYLADFVDESDPDVDVPNLFHAYQTAESIRARHPDLDWLILTGFIHDLGKILFKLGEPQWCVVGDTFPVGCEFSDTIVYGKDSFKNNPDFDHPLYSTKAGIYEAKCGLEKLIMSWGHDEYLYQVLKNHPHCTLPEQALYCIRFHSFYPYHTQGAYDHLMSEKDEQLRSVLSSFNSYDLYSKDLPLPDITKLQPFYQALIDKYIPGKIAW